MSEPSRRLSNDLAGLALAALAVFVIAALLSYRPEDVASPSGGLLSHVAPDMGRVFPASDRVENACGRFGAAIASMLISGCGLAAYLVAAVPGLCAYRLLRYGRISAIGVRSLGLTLTVAASTCLLAFIRTGPSGYPVVGAGGYLGAMLAVALTDHFAAAGAYILTVTLLLFGLLLWTDYLLLVAVRGVVRGVRGVRRRAPARFPGFARRAARRGEPSDAGPTTDLPETITEEVGGPAPDAAPAAPAIKFRGRKVAASDLDPHEAAEDGDAQPAESPAAREANDPDASAAASDAEGAADEADDEGHVRELEIDGQVTQLRSDSGHAAAPRIKTPKNRRDERQQLIGELQEELPAGSDDYVLPTIDLLAESDDICYDEQTKEVRRKATVLEQTFANFGFNVRVVEIETGPVIAQYEVELEAGLRLAKITNLADDLAIALRVPSVRIVAPIPGKNTVGIEVPNETRQVVRLREVIEEAGNSIRKMNIPIFLGKDVSGNPLTVDLASMPHLLIAGRTGTGKSVCLNAIISSMLMTRRPDEVRMLMIDPKMVELSGYGRLPHLMHPVVTDMKKAEAILAWAVEKMEERYSLLAKAGVRHINSYNQLGREELMRRLEIEEEDAESVVDHLPFIVIVADEMADLMMTAGKEVEEHIIRLAQKSRAVGIHLILATQKPTVDVITGLIKSNLPARLSFQVASRTDSRVVLDEMGADKLLGNGDMLFLWPGTSTLLRGQGTYLGDEEIDRVVAHCSTGEQNFVGELMNLKVKEDDESESGAPTALKRRDELYESAIEVVVREGRGSVSLLQRSLGIGYGRAARLIDFMAEDGIVGEYNGSQARDVIITPTQWEAMQNGGAAESEEGAASGGRRAALQRGDGWEDEPAPPWEEVEA